MTVTKDLLSNMGWVDVVEQILVRLDVEDVLRCKSVCKSWHLLISSPHFVTSHLKHAYKRDRENRHLGHRMFSSELGFEDQWFFLNVIHIVGTYNGLVCLSPEDVGLVICNPSTRQKRKLPSPPYKPYWRRGLCWGFGYADDDYKVIAGFQDGKLHRTLFYALTLKSNTWKFIGKVEYESVVGKSGTLCGGALHWLMHDDTNNKGVILTLDLSTLKFKEIPQPGAEYGYAYSKFKVRLGVIEDCLCISLHHDGICISRDNFRAVTNPKKWVMKNTKWELYADHDNCLSKYDVVHCWIKTDRGRCYGDDGGTHVHSDAGYSPPTSTYVKSLVSPHLHEIKGHEDNKSRTKGNLRKRKKRSCKHYIHKPFRLWN